MNGKQICADLQNQSEKGDTNDTEKQTVQYTILAFLEASVFPCVSLYHCQQKKPSFSSNYTYTPGNNAYELPVCRLDSKILGQQ